MTTESMRERFEAHMLRLNACTRLARQNDSVGGEYRTISVERAWRQWQAATLAERERAAKVCEALDAFDYDDPGSTASAAIRKG